MKKDNPITKLEQQVEQIALLKKKERFSQEYKKWHRDTEVAIEKIFGRDGRHLEDFKKIQFAPIAFSTGTPDSFFDDCYFEGLDDAKSTLESMIDELREYGVKSVTAPSGWGVDFVERICVRFHGVVRQLRERHDDRPPLSIEDEYDVQDLLHALLALGFDDIRPEEWTPSYAGGTSRVDFLLKQEQIIVEAKKTRKGLGAKEVGEQLIIDIKKYGEHPACKTLICFVYDPEGRIKNPRGIENDLTRTHDGIEVKVFIAPRT